MGLSREQLEKQAKQRIAPQVEKELGSKSLAYVSKVIRGLIAVAGVDKTRKQVIKSIEDDLKRAIRKDPSATVDSLIREAVNTPDYMALLKDLGMNEEHLRLLATDALEKAKR